MAGLPSRRKEHVKLRFLLVLRLKVWRRRVLHVVVSLSRA